MKPERKNWHLDGTKDRLCDEQGNMCACCGKTMGATGRREDYPTIEHIKPLCDGGADDLANIVITCCGCNNAGALQMSENSGGQDE